MYMKEKPVLITSFHTTIPINGTLDTRKQLKGGLWDFLVYLVLVCLRFFFAFEMVKCHVHKLVETLAFFERTFFCWRVIITLPVPQKITWNVQSDCAGKSSQHFRIMTETELFSQDSLRYWNGWNTYQNNWEYFPVKKEFNQAHCHVNNWEYFPVKKEFNQGYLKHRQPGTQNIENTEGPVFDKLGSSLDPLSSFVGLFL